MSKRTIPFAPQYTVTQEGQVFRGKDRVPPGAKKSVHGVNCLAVRIDGEDMFVWRILSSVFYNDRLILPADGNFLSWKPEKTVILKAVSSDRIQNPEAIHAVWYHYQHRGIPCARIGEASGLIQFMEDDFRILIRDILIAGIR